MQNAFFCCLERQLQESTKNILALFANKMDDPILLNQTYTILCSTYFKKVGPWSNFLIAKRKLTCLSIFQKKRMRLVCMTKGFKGVVWLHTKYRPLFLLPQLFKNAPKMHQCRVCRAGQVRTCMWACGRAAWAGRRADGLACGQTGEWAVFARRTPYGTIL